MTGIALKINANGDLEDSYTLTVGQFNNTLIGKSAIFFDDGSYAALWLSQGIIGAYGVSVNSSL